MAATPYPDNSFDHLLCINSIHWSEWKKSVAEVNRVMRPNPGGTAIIVMSKAGIVGRDERNSLVTSHFNEDLTPSALKDELELNGLYVSKSGYMFFERSQGQDKKSGGRPYLIAQRTDSSMAPWKTREAAKQIPIIDYQQIGQRVTRIVRVR